MQKLKYCSCAYQDPAPVSVFHLAHLMLPEDYQQLYIPEIGNTRQVISQLCSPHEKLTQGRAKGGNHYTTIATEHQIQKNYLH